MAATGGHEKWLSLPPPFWGENVQTESAKEIFMGVEGSLGETPVEWRSG